MKSYPAKQARDEFGRVLDEARREPVSIAKHGREVAVLMSVEEYERLEAASDAFWALRAEQAKKEGFLGADEGENLLADLLNAET